MEAMDDIHDPLGSEDRRSRARGANSMKGWGVLVRLKGAPKQGRRTAKRTGSSTLRKLSARSSRSHLQDQSKNHETRGSRSHE